MTGLIKRITLALTDDTWDALRSALAEQHETAWTLTARMVTADDTAGSITLLGRELQPVPEDAYESRTEVGLSITAQGWVPAFGAADRDEAIPVFIHTHPGTVPAPSRRDFIVDDQLARVAEVRVSAGCYASLVIGGTPEVPVITGRLHVPDAGWSDLTHLRAIGDKLLLLPAWSEESPAVSLAFDRQVRAFGKEGQQVLNRLRVGIVGAGGTGSAVIEQLIRLGIGELVVLDDQTLTDTNPTRVYGSGTADEGTLKVDLVERQVDRIGLDTRLLTTAKKVGDESAAKTLAHCDVILGCTDDNLGRTALTHLPQHLLQLYIDCAVVIDSRDDVLYEIFGRISIVTPGSPCLICMGEIDQDRALAESLGEQEYAERRREGYAPDLDTPDPAVVTFTTAIAAAVCSELLERLFHYGTDTPSNRLLHRFGDRSISRTTRQHVGSHHCGSRARLGAGEQEPFLGRTWA